jgi:hypothetical protein
VYKVEGGGHIDEALISWCYKLPEERRDDEGSDLDSPLVIITIHNMDIMPKIDLRRDPTSMMQRRLKSLEDTFKP